MTRLSPERLEELYAGTLRLVTEHGIDNVTMDGIAEATQSSKATLYRQWGTKLALVVAALRSITLAQEDAIDTGSLRGDLLTMVDRRVRRWESEGDLVASILHAVKHDAELRDAVREQIVTVARDRLMAVVELAVARGEVAADHPVLPYLALVVFAPFVLRLVIDDEPADEKYLIGYVDAVLLPALGIV